MSFRPEPSNTPSALEKLTRRARDAAETGDRLLVSLAHDLGGLGAWAKREASVVADAFGAAVYTTLEVTKKVSRRSGNGRPASPGTPPIVASPVVEASVIPASSLAGDASGEGSGNLDLLPATDDPCSRPGYGPGVLPVVDALERVVSEHARTGTRTLERDSRFWRLIQLLHLLKPPQAEAECRNEARGVPAQE